MRSIVQDKKECFVCKSQVNLEEHHVFFGKNRKLSEKDGLKVWLCIEHHRGTYGVHGREGHKLDLKIKQLSEQKYLDYYNSTKEDFIERYGRNYL